MSNQLTQLEHISLYALYGALSVKSTKNKIKVTWVVTQDLTVDYECKVLGDGSHYSVLHMLIAEIEEKGIGNRKVELESYSSTGKQLTITFVNKCH